MFVQSLDRQMHAVRCYFPLIGTAKYSNQATCIGATTGNYTNLMPCREGSGLGGALAFNVLLYEQRNSCHKEAKRLPGFGALQRVYS